MIRALLIACGLLAASGADARQVLSNPTFTSWPHGSPVRGAFGAGQQTAGNWVSKWGKSEGSVAYGSRAPGGGYRYTLHPDVTKDWRHFGGDGGETFYLRQYVRPLSSTLGRKFRTQITLTSHEVGVRGGWYIYPEWSAKQRLDLINTVGQISMPRNKQMTFGKVFTVPTGAGHGFKMTSAAALTVAFLFTTPRPATVDIRSFRMFTVP